MTKNKNEIHGPRPLWLLDPPRRLAEGEFALLVGPERIESGWWDGALAARDYFIARADDGALVWVFRARLPLTATDGTGWFLQGRFA